MAVFKIEEVREIIKGYTTSNYEVEAETLEEAIQLINDGEVDPNDWDCDIRMTEQSYFTNENGKTIEL